MQVRSRRNRGRATNWLLVRSSISLDEAPFKFRGLRQRRYPTLVTDPSVRRNGAGLEIFESSCFLRLISMRSLHRIGAKADTLTPYASATATVGIWHGAYLVEPHYSESIYVNMPRWVWLGREIICRMPACAIVRGNALPWTDAAAPGGTAPRRLPLLPLPPHGPVRPNRH